MADDDVFWHTIASGPTDGPPMAIVDFRRWAGIASKRIAAANAERDAALNLVSQMIEETKAAKNG